VTASNLAIWLFGSSTWSCHFDYMNKIEKEKKHQNSGFDPLKIGMLFLSMLLKFKCSVYREKNFLEKISWKKMNLDSSKLLNMFVQKCMAIKGKKTLEMCNNGDKSN